MATGTYTIIWSSIYTVLCGTVKNDIMVWLFVKQYLSININITTHSFVLTYKCNKNVQIIKIYATYS